MDNYRSIPGHDGYLCNPDGQIIGRNGRVLKGHIDKHGYHEVAVCDKGVCKHLLSHRLILSTFEPRDDMNELQVNHKNGIKSDNRIENLEWCTRSENLKHAYENGLERKCFGEDHHAHKLTEDDVRYIKTNYIKRDKEYGAVPLSEKFNVDRTTILDIMRGKTWRNIE